MTEEKIGIFWFRLDLRLADNKALNDLIKKSDKIIPIYIFDEKSEVGEASKWWLNSSLESLNLSLVKKNSKLYCFKGDPGIIFKKLIKSYKIKYINWNRLYDKYSISRDSNLKKKFSEKNIIVQSYNGSLINEPWTIKNKSGSFFKVFTPFWNNCLDKKYNIKLSTITKNINTINITKIDNISINDLKLTTKSNWTKILSTHWNPGEKHALENFNNFKNNVIENYEFGRDRPDKNYTSKLSPHLHFGEISSERIFIEINKIKVKNSNSKKKFLAEIGWREFAYNLLYNYPNIKTQPIQVKFNDFQWKKNIKYLKAWQKGQTGYPIVDAGMRQLYQTGWMHNRVRMIVGSFLCKNLLIHWWEGEKWFFDKLVDADLGSNSSGWQWIAGCGADAAPYFRIFNPVTQSLKFDSNGDYIKKFLPELKNIPAEKIHTPWKINKEDQKKFKCVIGKDYPMPIVDLSESRNVALFTFSKLKIKT